MAQNDRLTGLVGNAGVKVPVKAATTANITLTGEQTIDGVACVTGDRVLVKNQTTGSENGIYVVDSGAWSRAKDFDGSYDIVSGSMVRVNQGSSNASGWFTISTADPITIGSTSIAFNRETTNNVTKVSFTASAGQTLFALGQSYQVGANGLEVYINGLRARVTDDYAETSASSFTMTYALQLGDEVDCYLGTAIGQLQAANAANVALSDAGDYWVGTTVEAVLQEIAGGIIADNGDADITFTNATSARLQRWNTPLTANRTLTLASASAKEGAEVTIVRADGATGNFTLSFGALATLRAPGEWAIARYDAGTAAWILVGYGKLPSAEVLGVTAVGDADSTLLVASSSRTLRWATALTADRNASLSATGVYNGARFRVVREASATGNFVLNVTDGTATFARLAPNQAAEVEHTGAAWRLVAILNLSEPNTALVTLFDDFLGEEIDGFHWGSIAGTDAEARSATVLADQAVGVITMTTGDDAAATMAVNGVQLYSRLNWRTNKGGLVCEIRVALDIITNVALFIGLTDQLAALEMPFTLGAGDALTSNASDAVGVLFDTAADTDNWWLVGVKADVDAVKQNSALAPVAGTFETWRIELSTAGVASFYREGTLIGTAMAGAVTAIALLTPVVAAFSRSAASRIVYVDHTLVQSQR